MSHGLPSNVKFIPGAEPLILGDHAIARARVLNHALETCSQLPDFVRFFPLQEDGQCESNPPRDVDKRRDTSVQPDETVDETVWVGPVLRYPHHDATPSHRPNMPEMIASQPVSR